LTTATPGIDLYRTLVEARALEEAIQTHAAFYHSGVGMEAVGVGVASSLRPDDFLVAHYRGVGAPLAKGMGVDDLLRTFLLKATSPVRGRNWHPVAVELGIFGHQGTSGSEFGRAAGLGVAAKHQRPGAVAVGMFGDGSAQRGTLHEAFLLASAWSLPVLWVCENNEYMISTRADAIFPGEIAELAAGYRMRAETVDGNDVFDVRRATDELIAEIRRTSTPAFLEAKTFRVRPHTEVEAAPYQDEDEIERWRARDPLGVARARLMAGGVTEADVDAIDADAHAMVSDALARVEGDPGHDPTEDVYAFLYATETR
jgi:acetoin:2,6-dichlorophenolindophenol oxidoreductase subunit alpha